MRPITLLTPLAALLALWLPLHADASVAGGALKGHVINDRGDAVAAAKLKLLGADGKVVKEVTASPSGRYAISPVSLGDYQLSAQVPGFAPYQASVHVGPGAATDFTVSLLPSPAGREKVLKVSAQRR